MGTSCDASPLQPGKCRPDKRSAKRRIGESKREEEGRFLLLCWVRKATRNQMKSTTPPKSIGEAVSAARGETRTSARGRLGGGKGRGKTKGNGEKKIKGKERFSKDRKKRKSLL